MGSVHLQNFVARNNLLSGSLPGTNGNVTYKLRTVDLGKNFIQGGFPHSFYSYAPTLQGIFLDQNIDLRMSLSFVSSCHNLYYLVLDACGMRGTIPDEWVITSSLRALSLRGNLFSGTLSAATFVNSGLETMDISGNPLSGESTLHAEN